MIALTLTKAYEQSQPLTAQSLGVGTAPLLKEEAIRNTAALPSLLDPHFEQPMGGIIHRNRPPDLSFTLPDVASTTNYLNTPGETPRSVGQSRSAHLLQTSAVPSAISDNQQGSATATSAEQDEKIYTALQGLRDLNLSPGYIALVDQLQTAITALSLTGVGKDDVDELRKQVSKVGFEVTEQPGREEEAYQLLLKLLDFDIGFMERFGPAEPNHKEFGSALSARSSSWIVYSDQLGLASPEQEPSKSGYPTDGYASSLSTKNAAPRSEPTIHNPTINKDATSGVIIVGDQESNHLEAATPPSQRSDLGAADIPNPMIRYIAPAPSRELQRLKILDDYTSSSSDGTYTATKDNITLQIAKINGKYLVGIQSGDNEVIFRVDQNGGVSTYNPSRDIFRASTADEVDFLDEGLVLR